MRTRVIIAAVAALVVAFGVYSISSDGDGTDAADLNGATDDAVTSVADSTTGTSSDTSGSSSTTTEAPLSVVDNLEDVRWVVNDFDGLVDDQGRVLVEPAPIGTAASPTVARAIDGSFYFLQDDRRVWHWPLDAVEPREVEIDWGEVAEPDRIDGLAKNNLGQVLVNPYGEALVFDDGEPGLRQQTFSDPEDRDELGAHSMTAANGVTVEVLPITGTFSPEGGYLASIDEPASLQVRDADGEVVWTTTAGGTSAIWLDIVDFNGRHVMLSRGPSEPADPMIKHIVYDLDCPTSAAESNGCTDTFWARLHTAALVGPDREPGDDNLNPQLLNLCPVMGQVVATPAELTDPASFDEGFNDEHRAAFEQAALGLSLCDTWAVGTFGADGMAYKPDAGENGWLWNEFAAALRSPVRLVEGSGWVWSTHPGRASVVMSDESDPYLRFVPPDARQPGNLAVVLDTDHLVLAGTAESTVANNLRTAGEIVADRRDVELIDDLTVAGPRQAVAAVNDLLDAMANGFPTSQVAGEVQLTEGGLTVSTVTRTNPPPAERDLGFGIADFASGGEGVFDELPFAAEVSLAIGTEVRAVRRPLELSIREGWTVNATDFNGYSGPFNVLEKVPSPSEVTVGPQPRCGSRPPLPAPPTLASYRRINVAPLEDSIDSCLEWAAVELFVDDDLTIHGIRLDLVGP